MKSISIVSTMIGIVLDGTRFCVQVCVQVVHVQKVVVRIQVKTMSFYKCFAL